MFYVWESALLYTKRNSQNKASLSKKGAWCTVPLASHYDGNSKYRWKIDEDNLRYHHHAGKQNKKDDDELTRKQK
jgi:hypothetical protein